VVFAEVFRDRARPEATIALELILTCNGAKMIAVVARLRRQGILFDLQLVFHGRGGTENLMKHGHIHEKA